MQNNYKVIGVMSGTSLDGLDLAYCHFAKNGEQWVFSLEKTQSIAYDEEIQKQLKTAILLPSDKLLIQHNHYGSWLGQQTLNFINEHQLEVDFIASHGHTIHHQPQNGLTFQIGEGQHLSNTVQLPVVCDFRTGDVALGGQGAPLVPIGDALLFGAYDYCLNLGGIANISFEKQGKRVAYDIGIANMVLNYLCQKVNKTYDHNGDMARSGVCNETLFNALNALPYYELPSPKSTGYEWFTNEIVPIMENTNDTIENKLNTAVRHTAFQIGKEIATQQKPAVKQKLLITGGGALNGYFTEILPEYLPKNIEIIIPKKEIIEFKEALIFALMGVLRMRNEINILSSVTGASNNSSGGVVYLPQ